MDLFRNISAKLKALWQRFIKLSLIKKGIIIALIIFVSFGAYQLTLGKKSETPQIVTTQVEKGTLITSVSSSGTVSSANNATITTQSTGIVGEVYVENGDFVTAGQNIATIKLDQTSQQKNAAAYASYLSAVNNLNTAKSKINSLQSALFKANQTFINGKGSSSDPDTQDPTYIQQRADWLQAEADYNNQAGAISAAQAALSNASLQLAQVSNVITAPISGTISNLNISPGFPIVSSNTSSDTTTNSTSSNTVGNIKLEGANLQAIVNLTEIDVTKVKVGQKVTITLDAFSDKTFTGKVTAIDTNGSVSSGVTTYPATITFDTGLDNIYPNMAVSATIITDITNDVLLIPSSAIKTVNGVSFVTVQKDGKEEQVEVTTGKSNDTQTEIISGLSEGNTVVISSTASTTGAGGSTQNSVFGGQGFGGAMRATGGSGPQIRIQQR